MTLGDGVEKIQPQGVFFVGIITLLTALAALFSAYVVGEFGGGPSNVPDFTGAEALLWGFGILFLVDATFVFQGMRTGYYLSMTLWILLFSFTCYEYYFLTGNLVTISPSPFFAYPILYSVICLVYFSRKSVRIYFGT